MNGNLQCCGARLGEIALRWSLLYLGAWFGERESLALLNIVNCKFAVVYIIDMMNINFNKYPPWAFWWSTTSLFSTSFLSLLVFWRISSFGRTGTCAVGITPYWPTAIRIRAWPSFILLSSPFWIFFRWRSASGSEKNWLKNWKKENG